MAATRFVIPMKPLAEGKSRLRPALSDEQRHLMSLAMLVHVLRTTVASGAGTSAGAGAGAEVLALGGDRAVEDACNANGCSFVPDHSGDLNACLLGAFDRARLDGIDTLVFLPADLPVLGVEDVQALTRVRIGEHRLAIAPDRHNAGTNALAVRAPARLDPSMGGGSFVRHLAGMAMSGFGYEICRTRGLGLDIDTPADLETLVREQPDWWERAAGLVDGLDWRSQAP